MAICPSLLCSKNFLLSDGSAISNVNVNGPRGWCWCCPSLYREIASYSHVGTIHKVSHICIKEGGWQWRSWSMHIRCHVFRMIQGISCSIHRCTIRKVTNGVGEVGPWQWRSWGMWIWSNSLWMVDGIACPVHWRTIRQVALTQQQKQDKSVSINHSDR